MERILVVEDEPTNRAIMCASLRRAGYEVDEAEDGIAAWALLKGATAYALVVTDRRMPHMDGLELAQMMQADPVLNHTPILMQTASDKPDEVVEGTAAGVYYYLTKPYKEETLLLLVKSGIRERRRHEWFEQRAHRQKEALGTFMRGEFHIRTPEEAQNIAFLLGNIFPRPALAVSGLYELLLNAIEHGNLGIGFVEKARLLGLSEWDKEIIKRLELPEYADKKAIVQFTQTATTLEVIVQDEGLGFDWTAFMEIEPSRATQSNGRGIAKANLLSFDQLTYMGSGNRVRVLTALPKTETRA